MSCTRYSKINIKVIQSKIFNHLIMCRHADEVQSRKTVSVVVLGDIGRSPRMQYHALSFAESNFNVNIIGYEGSKPLEALLNYDNVVISYLTPPPQVNHKLLNYILKTIWQTISLLVALFCNRRSNFVLCQNPPAIPSLAVCWFYCLIMRAQFTIDWHNYAHSIMALTLGEKHVLVKVATWAEAFFGKMAARNFCVTKAMKHDLDRRWGIQATTLYDRPPDSFCSISLEDKHAMFKRLARKYKVFAGSDTETDQTAFTECTSNGTVSLRTDRPGLLVSSTSWTEDEDFSILLSALAGYEENFTTSSLPRLICVITGKGPLKAHYCAEIARRNWKNVSVVTPWLETNDYPRMLASADLGVCLHTSSSGLDLPMKVVDMFGCGLPVCAVSFNCLKELLQHNHNGYVFNSSEELQGQIIKWFQGFPDNSIESNEQQKLRDNLIQFQQLRWRENWTFTALPLFL